MRWVTISRAYIRRSQNITFVSWQFNWVFTRISSLLLSYQQKTLPSRVRLHWIDLVVIYNCKLNLVPKIWCHSFVQCLSSMTWNVHVTEKIKMIFFSKKQKNKKHINWPCWKDAHTTVQKVWQRRKFYKISVQCPIDNFSACAGFKHWKLKSFFPWRNLFFFLKKWNEND